MTSMGDLAWPLWLLLAAAAFAAGMINAIAGGGSLLSFPALLLCGLPPVTANATNTLAIWPGTLSSIFAYRDWIRQESHRAWVLAVPSVLGGLLGSILLLKTSQAAFGAVVPWLILFACGLLALQVPVARFVARKLSASTRVVPWPLWICQLLISVYGGYFGAGIGILMLAAMAIFVPGDLQRANGLKVLLAMLINGVSALYFLGAGVAYLPQAGLMAVMSILGGYVGARVAQSFPSAILRGLVITYGVIVAIVLFRQRWA